MTNKTADTIAAVIGIFFVAILMAVLNALFIKWAWNEVMPSLLGLKEITFNQAIWLGVLANCLFKPPTYTSKKEKE